MSIWYQIADFLSLVALKFDGWPWKTLEHLFYTTSSFCIISNPSVNWNWSYSLETLNLGQNRCCFVLCELENWWMTLKNNRAPLLCYLKLCATFHSHQWIQTGATVLKHPILVNIDNFFSLVTLKFNGWPSKTIGYFFYLTSSFVHHFIPIGELKFELQSGNAQFGVKIDDFLAVWPRNYTDDPQKQYGISSMLLQALCIIPYPLVNSNWSYSPEMPNLGQIRWFLEPCDLDIWRMTLQNNGAPLLCDFKLCASFHTHWWIQIWVTVRKRSIPVKIDNFFSRVT